MNITSAPDQSGALLSGAQRLRSMFAAPGVIRLVGAHNPLGARLAERAGFDGVWASGLEVSASQGVPDTDILTMSELLTVAGSLAAGVDVPVVADCDAGYGNAHNVMHMIRRYEAAGIAAVSIEDKQFPKANSFIPGRQRLAPIGEFCGKLSAAKAAQRGPDLMVIARIEALIAGWGMDEALRRGEAYAAAGADAVLIHAKNSSPEPILQFLADWSLATPVVVVPTTYHTITAAELAEAGAKMVIYANQGLRASITAVSQVFDTILHDGRTTGVEERIAPLSTVFDLQGMEVQKADEDQYITAYRSQPTAVVLHGPRANGYADGDLAAGRAIAAAQDTALTQVGAGSILRDRRSIMGPVTAGDIVDSEGRREVTDALAAVEPRDHAVTVVLSGDSFVEAEPLRQLMSARADIAVLVDVSGAARRADAVPVALSWPDEDGPKLVAGGYGRITALGAGCCADGAFAGAVALSPEGLAALKLAAEKHADGTAGPSLAVLLEELLAQGRELRAVDIGWGWATLRTADDVRRTVALLSREAARR